MVMMDLTRTYSPQQQALVLLSVSFDNIYYVIQYIDVGVMINDNHSHLRGEGGGVFTTVI